MDTVEQMFPFKQGDLVMHKRWSVDLVAAARLAGIPVERMTREAREMATHFPRWLLTLTHDGQAVRCHACQGLIVFDDGTRCVQCGKRFQDLPNGLRTGWFGVMPPVGIDGLTRIKDALLARPPRQHVVGHREGLGNYVLVPLVATYPGDFPSRPPDVFYLPEFRDIPGVPRAEYSHEFHMIGLGRMCLFAAGEWYAQMTCREVLQQRAYPHVIKFLNYANGKKNAFAMVS
ncbi:MAG: hypothetical protein AB2A00_08240 [Myxococcota bacterium]